MGSIPLRCSMSRSSARFDCYIYSTAAIRKSPGLSFYFRSMWSKIQPRYTNSTRCAFKPNSCFAPAIAVYWADCQARNCLKLEFHFNASFTALNLAKVEALQQHCCRYAIEKLNGEREATCSQWAFAWPIYFQLRPFTERDQIPSQLRKTQKLRHNCCLISVRTIATNYLI